jgi:hypothetical protein
MSVVGSTYGNLDALYFSHISCDPVRMRGCFMNVCSALGEDQSDRWNAPIVLCKAVQVVCEFE